MSSSREVLSLYRRILSLARVWRATVESDSVIERKYIKEEARRLFHKNKYLQDPLEIRGCIEEAKSRIDLALHYNNPYPRLVNFPQTFVPASKHKRAQKRQTNQSKPIYINSQE
ncbi:PREDICTED: LYR motif containing protein 1-like [Amphimedon queenslandica]|uniref:Complex 1 LYR protein domain-containing protein n=1 Tax=Amphimedon queenslandica TaxID=400682 RepID=A0A1X7USY9_AMPQE|nr:PREDICTED: LYR motif containing protein 1-like [Amphimedon queenslandica]|eukprot:XP_003386860.1 PREDICTED: LYR motif containing protein 1-like [Amphimedon queenslandica]